jgi:dTDP-glucose pyrophosphorylase
VWIGSFAVQLSDVNVRAVEEAPAQRRDDRVTATMQAVILARGQGTRMRRSDGTPLDEVQRGAADAGVKGMIAVGRPFLEYVISALADAGIREVILVVGPESALLRDHFTRVAPPTRTTIRYAVQEEPRP